MNIKIITTRCFVYLTPFESLSVLIISTFHRMTTKIFRLFHDSFLVLFFVLLMMFIMLIIQSNIIVIKNKIIRIMKTLCVWWRDTWYEVVIYDENHQNHRYTTLNFYVFFIFFLVGGEEEDVYFYIIYIIAKIYKYVSRCKHSTADIFSPLIIVGNLHTRYSRIR